MFSVVSNNQEQAQENRYLSLRISKIILARKGKNNCNSRNSNSGNSSSSSNGIKTPIYWVFALFSVIMLSTLYKLVYIIFMSAPRSRGYYPYYIDEILKLGLCNFS